MSKSWDVHISGLLAAILDLPLAVKLYNILDSPIISLDLYLEYRPNLELLQEGYAASLSRSFPLSALRNVYIRDVFGRT